MQGGRRSHRWAWGWALGLCGCAGSPTEAEPIEATDTDSRDTAANDQTGSTSMSADGSDDATSDDSEGQTTVPTPKCGNGMVEAPEQCDDGNQVGGDGCELDCTATIDTQLWQDVLGGEAGVADSGRGIAIDPAGHVVAVGFVVDEVGDPDVWLRKYEPDGTIVFTLQLDPSDGGDDRADAVAVDAQSNIIVAGTRARDASTSDPWIAKLDPDGSEIWSHTADGGQGSGGGATSLALDDAGDVFVVGHVRVELNDVDIWMAKFASGDGNELWTQTVAGPSGLEDKAMAVDVTSGTDAVVGGYVTVDAFDRDAWLRRIDPDGNEVWTTQYDGSDELGMGVAVASDGSIGLAGATAGAPGTTDAWLAKFDDAGELVWQKNFGGPSIEDDEALAVGTDGDAFIVTGFKGVAGVDSDIWIQRWDAGGNVVWTQNVSGEGNHRDRAWAIAVGDDGGFYLTGEIRPQLSNDGEVWVARFGP